MIIGRKTVPVLVLVVTCMALAMSTAAPVHAHGFGERYDLPVPLWYFIAGAAAVVAFSFVMVGVFVRGFAASATYPTCELTGRRWFDLTLGSTALLWVVKLASVFVLGLVIATSFAGSDKPIENLSPTLVWIIWWVGIGFVSATIGNVWRFLNPWKILFEWVEQLLARGKGFTPPKHYPESWSLWPAVVLFAVFAWLENVYSGNAVPFNLGVIIVVFSVIQWVGMFYFGKNQWLRHGDPLSVLFTFFSRLSVFETRVRDGRLCDRCESDCSNRLTKDCVECSYCFDLASKQEKRILIRPLIAGLIRPEQVSMAAMVFVILVLSTVTFDGLKETSFWNDMQRSMGGVDASIVDTIGLFGIPIAFLVIYLGFSWSISVMSNGAMKWRVVARAFVLSLMPIALAYHFAHFLGLLLIQGQFILRLASDPFGRGWNLFGSSNYTIDIGVINAEAAWFFAIAVIVFGHVAAVFISHLVSLREIRDNTLALRSQYPMLVLMVFYTAVSLWIISQPIVE